jgi:mannose-6-phosphate isomerase-like protein (cupin superfamily)
MYGENITTSEKSLVQTWQLFFDKFNWCHVVKNYQAFHGNCGNVYELPNFLDRPNEGLAIVDMRQIKFAPAHYHPDLEVYFILQGQALVFVGKQKYNVKQSDSVIIHPFKAHYVLPNSKCVIACVNTPPYTPDSYIELNESSSHVEFNKELYERHIKLSFK